MSNRSQQSNPNPNPRDERMRDLPGLCITAAAGARDALAPPLAGLRGTVEPPARRSGTLGSRVRGSRAWLRPRPARRRRAHPLASARAGEQAATVPSRSLPQATMASGRRRRVVWREKGEERMMLGFGARRRRRGFCSGENRGRPSDRDQRSRKRLAFWAGKRPRRTGEGTPRQAVSAARPLAVGPQAQGKVAEQAAGRFCSWAA